MMDRIRVAKERARRRRNVDLSSIRETSSCADRLAIDLYEERRNGTGLKEAVEMGPNKENVGMTPEKNFYFQQRHGRVDLKAISRIDLDDLVENVDIVTLQRHLENITFGLLDERDMQSFSDENLLKLFKTSQLTIEYLLNVQHTLYTYSSTLESRMAQLESEQSLANSKLEKQNEFIESAKRELKQKKKTIKTYEFLLTQRPDQSKQDGPTSEALDEEALEKIRQSQAQEVHTQMESMRTLLKEESEALRQKIQEEMDSQKREMSDREQEILARENELRAQLESEGRLPGRMSFAGSNIEPDDDIEHRVESLLAASAKEEEIQRSLSTTMRENDALKSRLESLERKTQDIEAERDGIQKKLKDQQRAISEERKSLEAERKAMEEQRNMSKDHMQLEEVSDGDIQGRKGDDTLLMKLAHSRVSGKHSDLRSLQLRRVLRIIRRRVQMNAFGLWRSWFVKLLAEDRERYLEEQLERLRRQNQLGLEGDATNIIQFVPLTYEWTRVAIHDPINPLAETRKTRDGALEARIPEYWPLKCKSNLGNISLAVGRFSTVSMVKSAIASEKNKQPNQLRVLDAMTKEPFTDVSTVEKCNFFNSPPWIQFEANPLTDVDVDAIMSQYKETHPIPTEPARRSYSPVPRRPEIVSQWNHDVSMVETTKSDIQSEVSRIWRTKVFSDTDDDDADYQSLTSTLPRLEDSMDFVDGVNTKDDESDDDNLSSISSVGSPNQLETSAPVNFGDYESSLDTSYLASAQASKKTSSKSDAKKPKDTGRKKPAAPGVDSLAQRAKDTASERYYETIRRFGQAGLSRRLQVDTLDLSMDTGSSNSQTSVSSPGESPTSVPPPLSPERRKLRR